MAPTEQELYSIGTRTLLHRGMNLTSSGHEPCFIGIRGRMSTQTPQAPLPTHTYVQCASHPEAPDTSIPRRSHNIFTKATKRRKLTHHAAATKLYTFTTKTQLFISLACFSQQIAVSLQCHINHQIIGIWKLSYRRK